MLPNTPKGLFFAEAKVWLNSLYQGLNKTGQEDLLLKEFLNGYFYSGMISKIASQTEVDQFIDDLNREHFGMTLMERKENQRLTANLETDFDSPTYERRDININF